MKIGLDPFFFVPKGEKLSIMRISYSRKKKKTVNWKIFDVSCVHLPLVGGGWREVNLLNQLYIKYKRKII